MDVDHGGVGLIASITWNAKTGLITGGHQRVACLDALEGHDNYLIGVDAVELDHAGEVAANISLNNPNLQGEYDGDLLAGLLKSTTDLNLEATGFEVADLQLNFDDDELASLFTPNEATAELVGELAGIKADAAEQKRASRAPKGGDDADGEAYTPGEHLGTDTEQAEPDSATKAKAFRKKGKDQFSATDDTEVVAHVICKNREEREKLVVRLGYDPDERYVDASRVWSRLKEQT